MQYTEEGEPKGFDPEHDVSLSEALDLVMHMHPSAKPLTVRKFLVGIGIHGNESGICGYAKRFEEFYVRIDRPEALPFRNTPECFGALPCDFWRIGMAMEKSSGERFAEDNIGHVTELTVSELPYRIRDIDCGALQKERVRLTQTAWGIHFPKQSLISLAQDPQWQAWGDVALALQNRGKRGRPQKWKWDAAKAALTIEASKNPEILKGGLGPIVSFLNSELRHSQFDELPSQEEAYAYARQFSHLWQPADPEAPID